MLSVSKTRLPSSISSPFFVSRAETTDRFPPQQASDVEVVVTVALTVAAGEVVKVEQETMVVVAASLGLGSEVDVEGFELKPYYLRGNSSARSCSARRKARRKFYINNVVGTLSLGPRFLCPFLWAVTSPLS